jgi:AcrR family transcriptional regulator
VTSSTARAIRPEKAGKSLPSAPTAPAVPDDNAKRRQILEGARQVFMRDGFDGASMNDVARVAGVSKGTLYVYFDSKVSLFEALVREDRQQQAEQVCALTEEDDERDLRSVLVRLGIDLVEMLILPASLAQLRTVIGVAPKFPQIGRALYESGPKYGRERLAAYLGRRVAKGDLAIDDLDLAADQLSDLYHGSILKKLMFCVEEEVGTQEIRRRVEKAVDVFMAAYKPV